MRPGRNSLQAITRLMFSSTTLTSYSVSPTAMVDAARVWPVGETVRYGIGPGLRVSIVNVNFTFGYSFNPHRLPIESPGAIYVKLDVTSLL